MERRVKGNFHARCEPGESGENCKTSSDCYLLAFDIVMSGHVVGDFWDEEIAELTRVCKSGGWLLDCPGYDADYDEGEEKVKDDELVKRGWEALSYDMYRKQIFK